MKVTEIRRYPVKAMGGESVASVRVEPRGLAGDRTHAVLDGDQRMASGKNSRRFRRRDAVFEYQASTTPAGVLVRGRSGSWTVGDPALDRALSEHLAARVRVAPETDVSFFDAAPVSLVGSASLEWCRTHLGVDGDVRRLRMNLVVQTTEPFVEESWVGRAVRVGEVELVLDERTERCRMVDIAQEGLPEQPGFLKALGRERDLCLGVYARVLTAGTLHVGDPVVPAPGPPSAAWAPAPTDRVEQ